MIGNLDHKTTCDDWQLFRLHDKIWACCQLKLSDCNMVALIGYFGWLTMLVSDSFGQHGFVFYKQWICFFLCFNHSCLYNVLCCKKKCGNPEVLKNCLRKLKQTISEAATRFSGYHQHVRKKNQLVKDISLPLLSKTVGSHYFEVSNFKFPIILNLNIFHCICHPAISYFPTILNCFSFHLRVQNYRFNNCISLQTLYIRTQLMKTQRKRVT